MRQFKRVLGLLFLSSCLATTALAASATVRGKVTVAGEGVAEIRVKAYPLSAASLVAGEPMVSEASNNDGAFSMELAPGQYYFLADGETLFTYYGRNPVTVPPEGIEEMNLALVKRESPKPTLEPLVEEGLAGQVSYAGKPLEGVSVALYTDLNSQLKGMGFGMAPPTDASGYFEVPLSPGTYYLVARKRKSGQFSGPLGAGDFFGYYAGNPLVIKPGEVASIGIDLVEVPQKVSRLAGKMFGKTSLQGKVLNAVGSAVAGVRVLLYRDSTMLNRPLYVSQPSAADGSYVLSFPDGGTYFLAARDKLGGAPGPGELYGRYTGSRDSSIRIRTGQMIDGVDMLVQEMW